MNFRKFTSMIVVLTMIISIFAFSALAVAGQTMEVTYENITNPGQAVELNDLFFAVIKLKGVPSTLQGGGFTLNFNKDVLQAVNTSGVASTTFGLVSNSGINTTALYADYESLGMTDNKAFEVLGTTMNNTTGTATYSYSSKITDGENYYDYPLTSTDIANGITLVKLRFKAVAVGNANLSFVTADTKIILTLGGANVFPTSAITPLTITEPAPTLYDVTVTNGTATPTSTASGASVSITADTAPEGQQFKNWTSSDVTFVDSTSATTTFTMPAKAVTVTANYEDIPVTLSTNANLSALSVTGVSFNETFSSNLLSYTATVANSVDSISINATKADSTATVAGDGLKSLSVGPNAFDVVVTAEDTSVVKTYVVTITREAPPVEGSTVEVGDISGYIGQNVIVPITFTDMTALNNFDVAVSYETSKLEYVGVTKGALVTETPSVNTATTGLIGISGLTVAHGVAGLAGDVVVANVTFKVIDTGAGDSTVSVVAGRYNSTNVASTNFVNGTVTYTLATDPLLTAATQAVEDYEAVVATTIEEIDSALATEKVAAEDAVALVVASESAAAKLVLEGRITAKTNALNTEKAALEAEAAATLLVVAYENASIATLSEIDIAEDKAETAYTAVNALRTGSVKTALLGRLADQEIIVAAQRTALTKAAALAAINAGTATIAEYQLIAPLATADLLANYNRGVVAGGSDLTESEVIALVEQVNTPAEPEITDVTIVGQAVTGSELSVTYDYYDANYDEDAGQTKVWTVTGGTPVTQATYTVAIADVTKTITVSVAGVSSSASLPVILRGDVTKSGDIYSDDALALREIFHTVGTYTDQQKEAADFNNDGVVDSTDLVGVLLVSAANIIPEA